MAGGCPGQVGSGTLFSQFARSRPVLSRSALLSLATLFEWMHDLRNG
jgi:hypothetical protein